MFAVTSLDPRALRSAFGSFMTGVTVVTACGPDGTPVGFTANSFSSVSLDPPLLLICPGKFLSTFQIFANCTHFAVNILAEGQEDISTTFASYKGDRFAGLAYCPDRQGVPLIDGTAARFSCTTTRIVDAGDHCILIGQVQEFSHSRKPGLGYLDGQYFSLGLERASLESATGTAICGAIIEMGAHVLLEETTSGFRPPQISSTARGQLRQSLIEDLTARGIEARLGQAYSVFDDRNEGKHSAYFLATGAKAPPSGEILPVPVGDLPNLTYCSPAIGQMMERFAREAQTRDFALYIGDMQHGDVHAVPERT